MPVLFALLLAVTDLTTRGFIESRLTAYPQTAINDSSRVSGELSGRAEGAYRPSTAFRIAGALDLAADTRHQTERRWALRWDDREIQRPAVSIGYFSALYSRGGLTLEAGKQLVRWGKTDIVNPTDRFAPRDFLSVVDNRFLAVLALRATWEMKATTIDAIWAPRFTPSRIPLWDQRWSPLGTASPPPVAAAAFPTGEEMGLRWSHTGRVDFSWAAYRGFSHEPAFAQTPQLTIEPFYPRINMLGGDAAIPLAWLTLKLEGAHFHSPDALSDSYTQVVIQLERQIGEWSFVGGYAGERKSRPGSSASFDPNRGLTRTILGRAGYALGADQNLSIEAAIRQDGRGFLSRFEYTRALGRHWQWIGGAALIRGAPGDFLGAYRRNSYALTRVRYSF